VASKETAARLDGAEDWNRTSDTSIFSAVLYQLSYLGPGTPHWQNPNHNTGVVASIHVACAHVARIGSKKRAGQRQ
jgi:hypothetical protein